ncbi:ABC transporter ATP-binding protein [Agrobacterium genomosp. 3 str. RTP8]|nr:ABC transporter ATP-binding protein [Agrobacterium tomkonis RTP8]
MVAVDDLSFDVPRGRVLGIGGPNGAGKTTLFDLISGVTRASSGSVTFEGRDVSRMSAEQLCHLGIARTFQLNAVFDTMTVRENLTCSAYFGERNRVIPSLRFDKNAKELAEHAMETTGLAEFADKMASGLPVLQRKLLMLASAIASKPRLLLLDEPVGGLNAREIEQCTDVFRRLRDDYGMTIVVIEHVMSFMTAIADTVMILHQGRKLYHGSTADLSGNAAVVEVYLGISGTTDLAAASKEKQA